jgi:hypothetical protein
LSPSDEISLPKNAGANLGFYVNFLKYKKLADFFPKKVLRKSEFTLEKHIYSTFFAFFVQNMKKKVPKKKPLVANLHLGGL